MDPHFHEWLNLAIRWVHMITGIAWIGASFYFVWLENNLNRVNPRTGLSGDLWAIHGGGIYHLEKYKLAPPQMPENLHWFKWEAYFTWITGMLLLAVVFYMNADLYLLRPDAGLTPVSGVALGVAALVAGWFIYDFLCDSALGKQPALLGGVIFVLLIAAAYGFSQVFSGRGAFIHVGAIIGTIMVGNVFRIIMPAQRALVKAIEEGREPDPVLPAKGLLRSRHNNYLTLPVLFIMISNHFPSTYGHAFNWAVLAALAVLSVLVRHYFNTRHDSNKFAWTLPVAALGMVALAFVTAPERKAVNAAAAPVATEAHAHAEQAAPVSSDDGIDSNQVFAMVQERCSVCHSSNPTHSAFATAPAGVMIDSPAQMQQLAARIYAQTVATQVMPLGNLTQMTPEERQLLGQWVDAGAQLDP
ncbi:urate hydroxylase PuuD [Balneatrix alpica]|uniref:Urate hydroxylase PuuD n=1 Tax=Balneatrix alpica TaxID=75684 RepID=A0ABV5ZAF3_9GAMM|nr:urate hydroxylase PuuD [Balneatrix alpica]